MIKKLIYSGVREGLSFKEQSKLRIFNTSCLSVCLIMALYAALCIFQERYLAALFNVTEFFVLLFVLFLHSLRMPRLAYHVGFVNALLFIFSFSILFGENTQSHIFLLFIPIATLIVFDDRITTLLYFIASIGLLIISRIVFKYQEPYFGYGPADEVFGMLNCVFTGVMIFLSVTLFKNENTEFTGQINMQRKMLEGKNKDITDSITYAKRIQKALMASDSLLAKNLPEHFILYKPKDIVSGDFYWADLTPSPSPSGEGRKFLIATCDCTGHGVPGAFMSLLGVSFLNEITKEKRITQPDQVFNMLRENIINALNPEGNAEEGKDGMDAVLCSFDFENRELEFACANNPIWILRNGQWLDCAADKFPIGIQGELKPFTLQKIALQKGDLIYTLTDGYADQFGGTKGKKFKYKALQQLLSDNSSKSMKEQKDILNTTIENWKGNLEQVDDILVIGIRV